jgi:two-component system, OmpR family, response regulator
MAHEHEQQRRRILIVDGDQAHTNLVVQTLAAEGFDVEVSQGDHDVLEHVRVMQPSAVILDVTSTNTDGFNVLRQLRNDTIGRRLPVIVTTWAWRTHEKCREIGFTYRVAPTVVLPKPFASVDLMSCLSRLYLSPGQRLHSQA